MKKIQENNQEIDNQVTFVCVEKKGVDDYGEDERGVETYSINYTSKVVEYTMDIAEADKFINDYADKNASDPPYEYYKVKLCYWTKTKEIIPLEKI